MTPQRGAIHLALETAQERLCAKGKKGCGGPSREELSVEPRRCRLRALDAYGAQS